MKVVLTDGTTFTCGGYKALDSGGVVLTDDPKRKHVVGYVPEASLAYILPDGVEPGGNDEESEGSEDRENGEDGDSEQSDDGGQNDEDGDSEQSDDGGQNDEDDSEQSDDDVENDEDDEGEAESDDPTAAVTDEDDGVDETVVSVGVEPAVEGVTSAASDDAVGEHTHEDIVERVEQLESRVDRLDGRVDAMTDQLADVVARGAVAEDEARSPEDVRNIRGIGEAYATRLRASGIDTVAALSEASDAEIAAAVGVSERRASEWRRRAGTAAESEVTDDV